MSPAVWPRVRRPLGAAALAALVVAAAGMGWERVRFGGSERAAAVNLEQHVRLMVADRSDRVIALAQRVAAEHALIVRAESSEDALADLFGRMAAAASDDEAPVTATVYVPNGGVYRLLAWSDGPAGEIAPNRLNGAAELFVAPGVAQGSGGIRLVYVLPIEEDGHRLAVVAAETVLSRVDAEGLAVLNTPFGPVEVLPKYFGAGGIGAASGPVIRTPGGAALLEMRVDHARLGEARSTFRRRTAAAAALPFALAALWLLGPVLDDRRRARSLAGWLGRSAIALVLAGAAVAIVAAFVRAVALPRAVETAALAALAVACAALVPGGIWWRRWSRHGPPRSTAKALAAHGLAARFVLESTLAGVALAVIALGVNTWLAGRLTTTALASWQSSLFPFDVSDFLDVWTTWLVVIALAWTAAAILGAHASRWRLRATSSPAWIAWVLWLLPTAVVLFVPRWRPPAPVCTVVLAAAIATIAVWSPWIRHYVRHTTQVVRLFAGFVALLLPLVAAYPLAVSAAERATHAAIERDYGPATVGQADRLRDALVESEREIDAMPTLSEQVKGAEPRDPLDSQMAFSVWRQTALSQTRVVSDIELYSGDRALVSRFAFGFPEYVGRIAAQPWTGDSCAWQVSGEVTRFGAADRAMLHAARGLCDAHGDIAGAVVLHVAPNDYQALPFLASSNPYADVFDIASVPARVPDLELVVYGWSLRPLFVSGRAAWSIDPKLADRLYRDRTPLWTQLESGGRRFDVYVLQNRAGIYALGYPRPTIFQHAARLAEMAAVAALLFIVVQVVVAVYAPMARRRHAPLRVLLHEVRTSFYRKLFLFFVLVAVGPVFLFALIFGAYMTSAFRADVESEAAGVVTVARRVFEQVVAVDDRPNAPAPPPTDDVMVWIRQVIGQDVNLFEGAELRATSQRDLYNSGLLPTRTPAGVYRRVALERLPWFVTEDGQFLVAASAVSVGTEHAVLSVPLASRQREIADEFDELHRGVLVGSILVVLFSAGLGASLAGRVADPVSRLTKATRQIAAGRLDVRVAADTADELGRLVEDFNSMAKTLVAQRAELARANQLKAWNEMARQVAHEIKNPLTPVQLAAEHLQRVHEDRGRPLGETFNQCVSTILGQVRLLRQIASEFANFASEPPSRPERIDLAALVEGVVGPYRLGLAGKVRVEVSFDPGVPSIHADRTLLVRALTNIVENAIQAMPTGGALTISGGVEDGQVVLRVTDTGVGMDAAARQRAFEPYFSTKTGGSGLGLANAKRNIEREGGSIALTSELNRGTTITMRFGVDSPRI